MEDRILQIWVTHILMSISVDRSDKSIMFDVKLTVENEIQNNKISYVHLWYIHESLSLTGTSNLYLLALNDISVYSICVLFTVESLGKMPLF